MPVRNKIYKTTDLALDSIVKNKTEFRSFFRSFRKRMASILFRQQPLAKKENVVPDQGEIRPKREAQP